MTLIQIGEYLAERAGRKYDAPFNLQMQDAFVTHRARYVANRLQKQPNLKTYYLQPFKDKLIDVNKDECTELAECNCENVKRTEHKIPRPLIVGTHPFEYIGNPFGTDAYGWTTFGSEPYLSQSPVTGKMPRYTYLNDYVYVFNAKNDELIRGEGVFVDPRALKDLQACSTDTEGKPIACYSASIDFPVDDDLIQVIIEQIMLKDLHIMRVNPLALDEKVEVKPDKNV